MIKSMNKIALLVGVVAGMAVVGCVKEKDVFEPGTEIRFSASSSSLETRTVYDPSGATGGKHYINWVTGDGMTILMTPPSPGTASNRNYKVKTVSSVNDDPNSDSKATVESDGGSPLTWSSKGTYTFYAMYPAAANSSYPLKGKIPSTQTASTSLPFGYMYADPVQKLVEARKTVTDINLYFRPYFTAYHFTLKNKGENDIKLSSFKLTSTTNALNGDIEYTTGSTPAVSHKVSSNVLESEKTITVSDITVPGKGDKEYGYKEFIITALPNTHASLTVEILREGDTDSKSLTMSPQDGFTAQMKHNITMELPSFASYEYTFEVMNPTDLADLDGTSSTAVVRSYKSNDGGNTKTPVSWVVEGYYDTAEHAATGGSTGLLNPGEYDWLTSIDGYSGLSDEQTLEIRYNTLKTYSSGLATQINNAIKNTQTGGASADNAVNLAKTDNYTITQSANCYIVHGYGWFKIPIVMGNGVKSDGINLNTYTYKGGASGGSAALARTFYDYTNNPVTTPILDKPSYATVLWQDVNGLVSLPLDENNFLDGDKTTVTGSASGPNTGTSNVYWLRFEVPQTKIAQGNAVIAVKDNSKKIMWSYHIWVTNYNPDDYLLGWVTTQGSYKKCEGVAAYLRLKQEDSETARVLSIVVPEGDPTETTVSGGYAPYYQWGRKDPIMPNISNVYNGSGTSISSVSVFSFSSTGNNAASFYYNSILRPDQFMQNTRTAQSYTKCWLAGAETNYNYWCAEVKSVTNASDDISTILKTIFDPCPAGYSVPNYTYFSNKNVPDYEGLGYRIHKVYGSSNTPGALTSSGSIYLWTAIPGGNSSSLNPHMAKCYDGSTISYHNMGDALCILPMANSN